MSKIFLICVVWFIGSQIFDTVFVVPKVEDWILTVLSRHGRMTAHRIGCAIGRDSNGNCEPSISQLCVALHRLKRQGFITSERVELTEPPYPEYPTLTLRAPTTTTAQANVAHLEILRWKIELQKF